MKYAKNKIKNRKGAKTFSHHCVYIHMYKYLFIFFFLLKKFCWKKVKMLFFNYIINSHVFAWSVVFVSFGSFVVVGWKEL